MDEIDNMIADLEQCVSRLKRENHAPRDYDRMINTLLYIESLAGDLYRILQEDRLNHSKAGVIDQSCTGM